MNRNQQPEGDDPIPDVSSQKPLMSGFAWIDWCHRIYTWHEKFSTLNLRWVGKTLTPQVSNNQLPVMCCWWSEYFHSTVKEGSCSESDLHTAVWPITSMQKGGNMATFTEIHRLKGYPAERQQPQSNTDRLLMEIVNVTGVQSVPRWLPFGWPPSSKWVRKEACSVLLILVLQAVSTYKDSDVYVFS